MVDYQTGGHSVYDIKYHMVWVTKYRYHVLTGEVAHRTRELIRQCCMARDITIIKGNVGKDHIHLLVACPPTIAPAKVVQYLKGRSSRLLRYGNRHHPVCGDDGRHGCGAPPSSFPNLGDMGQSPLGRRSDSELPKAAAVSLIPALV